LNFSRSRTAMALAARRAVREIEGKDEVDLAAYTGVNSPGYQAVVDRIRQKLRLTTLRYQILDDMVAAIGLPREKLCTHCWDASSHF
ncbi:MAG: amidophosphoribosyltransferase, partial [Anaerolineae bacterium]